MRNTIITSLVIGGMAATLWSCDDNAWNDKLDGFDGNAEKVDQQTVEYTLTDADYATISSNSTNKSLAAASELTSALAAVGTKHYFTEEIPASKYAPAFLASDGFKYFALSNGSSIKLTYNVYAGLPEKISELEGASQYAISDEEYAQAWESDEDFISAYTPSVSPTKYIPKALATAYPDATSGQYALVSYAYSEQEPIFTTVSGGDEEEFILSNVIGTISSTGGTVDINGIVTGKCTRGFVITDASGSVFVYNSKFEYDSYQIGDQLVVSGVVNSYNKGYQIDGTSAVIDVAGHTTYNYPAPKALSAAEIDDALTRTTDALAEYVQITGKVVVSGNYINVEIPGTENSQGSIYYASDEVKAMLHDGEQMTISGYFVAISGKGPKYLNMIVTSATSAANSPLKAAVVPVPTTNVVALYTYNGKNWSAVTSGVTVLQPSDYVAMGQTYGNLSNALPEQLLPKYLANKYPYAAEEDSQYVMYKYYNGSSTNYRCDQYNYDGTCWIKNTGVVTETSQFVKNKGTWNFDPSVTLTLPAGKGQALSATYYQACVDWVYVNVDKPLGSTSIKDGQYYVSSYGNNEYYSGTSAYQNNVDLRASAAITQYPKGYEGMSDTEIVELMKQRFAYQVMPGALSSLHPDAAPIEGMDVLYTINFGVYTGANETYTIVFKVAGTGKFEFVTCDWWENGEPAQKLDLEKYMK